MQQLNGFLSLSIHISYVEAWLGFTQGTLPQLKPPFPDHHWYRVLPRLGLGKFILVEDPDDSPYRGPLAILPATDLALEHCVSLLPTHKCRSKEETALPAAAFAILSLPV